jgi:hypothetical protein
MAQENGSRFKLVYSHWFYKNGIPYPLSNGLHPLVIAQIQEYIVRENPNVQSVPEKCRVEEVDRLYANVDSGILYRHSELFSHFAETFSMDNIIGEDEIVDDDSVYLFPVEFESDRFRFLKDDVSFTVNDTTIDYNFVETLTPNILNLIQSGRVKLIVSNMVDPSLDEGTLVAIEEKLSEGGISGENVIFLQGNIISGYQGKMKMLGSDISLFQTSTTIPHYPFRTSLGYVSDYVREEDLDVDYRRGLKFLCFNRNMHRIHRLGLAHVAIKYNILTQGFFSFLAHVHPDIPTQLLHVTTETDEELKVIAEKIKSLIPYELDTQHVDNKMSFTTNENNNKHFYANSYLHITSETEFDNGSTPFLSEKTWRPILNLQPFIYVGNYKSLEKLRSLGFKTFSPFIDEDYDLIEDRRERFFAIEQEIKKFADMSLDEIHEWYHSITDVLIHNQNVLKSYIKHNPIEEIFTL